MTIEDICLEVNSMGKSIKCRHNPEIIVDATHDAFTGRPLVTIWQHNDFIEDIMLTPVEAERLGRALMAAAEKAKASNRE